MRRPTHQEIAARAYEIYLARGRQEGHDVDDWLQAEYELMQLPTAELATLDPPAKSKSDPAKPSLVEVVKSVRKP